MAQGFFTYLKAAFNARPLGMWIPPNWMGLGIVAALGFLRLGFLNEGIWIVGAGAELAYLLYLSTNARFQKAVDAQANSADSQSSRDRVKARLDKLPADDQEAYRKLESRCQKILSQQQQVSTVEQGALSAQSSGLGRLLWIYLGLLVTRRSIELALTESEMTDRDADGIRRRMADVTKQLTAPGLSDDLKKSLEGQLDILNQRAIRRKEAEEKLAFIESELTRIVEQVELIREQAVVTPEPEALSQRIDSVGATLTGTTKWMQDQQSAYGQVDDVLDPPPMTL